MAIGYYCIYKLTINKKSKVLYSQQPVDVVKSEIEDYIARYNTKTDNCRYSKRSINIQAMTFINILIKKHSIIQSVEVELLSEVLCDKDTIRLETLRYNCIECNKTEPSMYECECGKTVPINKLKLHFSSQYHQLRSDLKYNNVINNPPIVVNN